MCSRVCKFSTVQLEIATDWVGDLCFVTQIYNPNWWSLCGWENSCPLSAYVCSCWRSLPCWSLVFLVVSRFGVFDSGSTYMTEWERCLFPTFWSSSQHKHKVVCCVLFGVTRWWTRHDFSPLLSALSLPSSLHTSIDLKALSISLSLFSCCSSLLFSVCVCVCVVWLRLSWNIRGMCSTVGSCRSLREILRFLLITRLHCASQRCSQTSEIRTYGFRNNECESRTTKLRHYRCKQRQDSSMTIVLSHPISCERRFCPITLPHWIYTFTDSKKTSWQNLTFVWRVHLSFSTKVEVNLLCYCWARCMTSHKLVLVNILLCWSYVLKPHFYSISHSNSCSTTQAWLSRSMISIVVQVVRITSIGHESVQ